MGIDDKVAKNEDPSKWVLSRKGHSYDSERETPLEEIPPEFRQESPLPGGGIQITDTRLCYNFNSKGRLVECGSVWSHAAQEGFISPEDKK